MILSIIQARMSSKRLPGKVLMKMNGKPMLQWVIEAAQRARLVDKVIVATSCNKKDEAIIEFAGNFVDVFPGDLNDVLDRFYQAALRYKPSHIVRLTGDCPMLRPETIDETVRFHLMGGHDYTCNFDYRTIDDADIRMFKTMRIGAPSGLDVEVFTFNTLVRAAKLATLEYDREHVTPFMRSNLFKVGRYMNHDLGDIKLSVDTREDFERVTGLRRSL